MKTKTFEWTESIIHNFISIAESYGYTITEYTTYPNGQVVFTVKGYNHKKGFNQLIKEMESGTLNV